MPQDYSDIGFTSSLQGVDSLASKPRNRVQGLDFDSFYSLNQNSLNYTRLQNRSRAYQAVVSPGDEPGTYKDLQTAINYVANSVVGGAVFLKTGIHYITNDITIPSNVSLIGEDRESTFLDFNFDTSYSIDIKGTDENNLVTNVMIQNLQLRNWGTSGSSVLNLPLQINYAKNVIIDNNIFKSCYSATQTGATVLIGSNINSDVFVTNNLFDTCRQGIKTQISSQLLTVDTVRITNNTFTVITETAIGIGNTRHTFIHDNYFYNVGDAITLTASTFSGIAYVSLVNNIIDFTVATSPANGYGIYLVNSGGGALIDVVISGNILTNINGAYGIFADSCAYLNIISNQVITNTKTDGIRLTTTSNSVLSGNISTSSAGYGINLTNAGCDRNIVTSNFLNGNTTGGLNNSGSNTSTGNNIVS